MSEIVKSEYLHSELTGQILSVAFEVHQQLKFGFQEKVYQNAMIVEFGKRKILFEPEKEMDIIYKGVLVGQRRVDFLVANTILVEIKSVSLLDNNHLAQAINYLEVFNLEVGLLINFGASKLEYRRVVHPRLITRNKNKEL